MGALPQSYMQLLQETGKMLADDARKAMQNKLVRTADYFRDIATGSIPPDQFMLATGRPGLQDDPEAIYPNAQLPCLDQSFAIPLTDVPASSELQLTQASLAGITLLSTGYQDPGAAVGLWWPQSYADTTIQKDGQLVFLGHTYWGTAHSIAFEGVAQRGGTGLATDPLVFDPLLATGAGSYAESILRAVATRVGVQLTPQGSLCPSFLGNLAYTGDQGQLFGPGLPSVSNPNLPFKRWERPVNFGSRDSAYKTTLSLTMGPSTISIPYIAGNPPNGDIYALFRLRVCGFRVCGTYVPGCSIVKVG